ncbi:hypothetical protein B7494_g7038 [Chlorociboria aeruginascens]|nr:hypothetical protein B7494_g7038 [Chlorociboria aeruginascens]
MSEAMTALFHYASRSQKRPYEFEYDGVADDGIPGLRRHAMYQAGASKRNRLTSPSQFAKWNTMQAAESDNDDSEIASIDGIPPFFHPSLDMTTALESAHLKIRPVSPCISSAHSEVQHRIFRDANLMSFDRVDLVPNFYAYSIQTCLLPIRKVQHELITLYFHYVHPMFPVVDEHHMTELHRKYRGQEEFMDPLDFVVYHAIMVAGFAHLSEAQVCLTPYRSVPEGQEVLVDQLKARYWSQPTADPVVLTQISLILSLWSPGWPGAQNNSYWLDMAFKHATMGRLWESQSDSIALGMRRPHRLHQAPIEDAIISEKDFGLEAQFPIHTDLKSKQIAVFAFIWFCRLRNGSNGDNAEKIPSELEEVSQLHQELKSWLEAFEATITEVGYGSDEGVPIPISTLRIIAHSLLASLYQPYLHLSVDHPALVGARIDPLQRMKDGAREVAISVRDIMSNKKSDAIPTWLVSWVTLPVIVYHVNQRIRLNASPDEVLMPFLAQLGRRTSGALMIRSLLWSGIWKDTFPAPTPKQEPAEFYWLLTTGPSNLGMAFLDPPSKLPCPVLFLIRPFSSVRLDREEAAADSEPSASPYRTRSLTWAILVQL